MSTFLDLATDSLVSIGQGGQGQSISPEMSQQALRVCNRMIANWSLQRLMLYVITTRTFTLTGALQDYTIGPSAAGPGSFVGPRPDLIESCYAIPVGSQMHWQMSVLDRPKWGAIADIGAMTSPFGVPQSIYPEYLYPNLAFHVWPIPQATCQITLGTWELLQQFVTIFDTVNFPPGYEKAITLNLALELCPYYDIPPQAMMATLAAKSLVDIQTINAQSLGGALSDAQLLNAPTLDNPSPGQAQVQPASQPTQGQ
jgi:hypothetical protein